jgi:sporulation protein YqfC
MGMGRQEVYNEMKKRVTASQKNNRLMENVADTLKLPKDLLLGAAILTVTGQCEAYVENYSGIIEYTDKKIKLQTKTCRIEISGDRLMVVYYTNDEMKIIGQIDEIKYQH